MDSFLGECLGFCKVILQILITSRDWQSWASWGKFELGKEKFLFLGVDSLALWLIIYIQRKQRNFLPKKRAVKFC
ncbi:hypothetical protein APPUASWS_000560 [Arthrospira platensis str. Paraca]|nr:hypothetical protein APPUASWS_000560 [Arthrospira platensis str. Paraca]